MSSRTELLRHALHNFFKYGGSSNDAAPTTGLTHEEDKCLYETSRTDSGFLSSGNLISSEIISEEFKERAQQDSGILEDCPKRAPLMRLDSGIDTCLSQFSGLSIKQQGLNDLGKSGRRSTETEKAPWELYYEQDVDGDTHLHIAILQGFPEVALALIRAAPHPRLLDTLNDDAQSPLHLAVATGQWRVARWLVVAGARPSPRNLTGDSPLHVAAHSGDLQACRAVTDPVQRQERDLLGLSYPPVPYQPCELDQWNYDGQTSVHVAAIGGNIDVLRHLVWHGADINAREGKSGYTALHYAIERSDERLVQFLLSECKRIDVSTLTYAGRSALQLGLPVRKSLLDNLLSRGVPSPYSSENEDEDSDDEGMYDEPTSNIYNASRIINASA